MDAVAQAVIDYMSRERIGILVSLAEQQKRADEAEAEIKRLRAELEAAGVKDDAGRMAEGARP